VEGQGRDDVLENSDDFVDSGVGDEEERQE
jgi:hypothetical protein